MLLHELFYQKTSESATYKSVDPATVVITDDELEKLKKEYLIKKVAAINSENYRLAVIAEPVYRKPSYIEVYQALTAQLTIQMNWEIDEYNELPLKKISAYFSGDNDFELMEDGYSLKKGLLLYGPVGCGKTSVMQLFQKNSFNPFRFVSCRKVAAEYAEFGQPSIKSYSETQQVTRRDWFGHDTVSMCFDDLGTESEKRNFGNQINVMAEIILNRYDYIKPKNKTMITTNLSLDQISEYYGERALSRMREMFNVIEFDFNSPDRRK